MSQNQNEINAKLENVTSLRHKIPGALETLADFKKFCDGFDYSKLSEVEQTIAKDFDKATEATIQELPAGFVTSILIKYINKLLNDFLDFQDSGDELTRLFAVFQQALIDDDKVEGAKNV